MYYSTDDFGGPGPFVLQDEDRFHAIRHSGEIRLADGTLMMLVVFIIRRAAGTFDQYIVNKFLRADGTTNKTLMSKCGIAADQIEGTLEQTTATFGQALRSRLGPPVQWDELDLRAVSGKDEQIDRIRRWGRLHSVRVESP